MSEDKEIIKFDHKGKIFEFEAGENLSHEFCSTSCKRKGRGHYHFVKCKGGDKC